MGGAIWIEDLSCTVVETGIYPHAVPLVALNSSL